MKPFTQHRHGTNKVEQGGATWSNSRICVVQHAYQGLELVLGGCTPAFQLFQRELEL